MAGQPGRSGTNKGKFKHLSDLLSVRLLSNEKKELSLVVDKIIAMAKSDGPQQMAAANFIADRLEGKVAQQISQDPDGDPIRLIITGVPRATDDDVA